jgi:hypothetical protein
VPGFDVGLRVLIPKGILPIGWVVWSIADSNIVVPGLGVAIGEIDEIRV